MQLSIANIFHISISHKKKKLKKLWKYIQSWNNPEAVNLCSGCDLPPCTLNPPPHRSCKTGKSLICMEMSLSRHCSVVRRLVERRGTRGRSTLHHLIICQSFTRGQGRTGVVTTQGREGVKFTWFDCGRLYVVINILLLEYIGVFTGGLWLF